MFSKAKLYKDTWTCPKCSKTNITHRKVDSSGKEVPSFCPHCRKTIKVKAGLPKD